MEGEQLQMSKCMKVNLSLSVMVLISQSQLWCSSIGIYIVSLRVDICRNQTKFKYFDSEDHNFIICAYIVGDDERWVTKVVFVT